MGLSSLYSSLKLSVVSDPLSDSLPDPLQLPEPLDDPDQMALFTEYVEHPVVETLRELKLDSMSPLDAFDALRALAQDAQSGASTKG